MGELLGKGLCMSMLIKRMMECPKCGHQYSNGGLTKSLTLQQVEEEIEMTNIQEEIEMEELKVKIRKLEGTNPPCV